MDVTQTVGSVMTPGPIFIDQDEMSIRARALMKTHGVRHLAVLDQGKIVGIVSERDLRLVTGGSGVTAESRTPVSTVSRSDAYVVDIHEPLVNVLETMASRRIGSALVTQDEKLVGIFTSTDACRLLAEHLTTG